MRERVSSHDVARRAGVSQSTVSLVMSGRAGTRISEETRQRVLEAARQLNYTRNAAARALVTGRTHRIGIVLNTPHSFQNRDNYHGDVFSGVVNGALRRNYNLLFHSASYPDGRTLCGDILNGSADGVLLVGRYPHDELTTALLEARFPTVCVYYYTEHPTCRAVDCDNERGGYLAARHLLDLGHTSLAFFSAGDGSSWIAERRAGVERAVCEAGLSPERLLVSDFCYRQPEPADPAGEMAAFLRRCLPMPTGLIFCDEWRPQQLAEALPAHGLCVPEDLSIISFNSTDLSARTRPPLTSVWQPLAEMGEAALDLVVDLIEGKDVPPGVRRFPVRLDPRESCGLHRR